MRFFDRASELADLREIRKRSEDVAQFTVVTGRRRVGKTSLVMKSLEGGLLHTRAGGVRRLGARSLA